MLAFSACSERSSPIAPIPVQLANQGTGPEHGGDIESPEQNVFECQQALDQFVQMSSLTSEEKWLYNFFLEHKNGTSYEDTLQYLLEEVYNLEYLEPGFSYDSSIGATEQYYYIVWLTRQIMVNRPPYGDGMDFPDANYLTDEIVQLVEERSNWVPLPPGVHALEVGQSENLNPLCSTDRRTMATARVAIAEAVTEIAAKPYLSHYSNYRVMWLLSWREEMTAVVPSYFGDPRIRQDGPDDGCAACHNSVARARSTSQFVAGTVTGVIVGAATGGNPFIGGAAGLAAWGVMDEINDFVFQSGEYCNPDAEEEDGGGSDSFLDNPWLGGVYCDGFYCSPSVP
jgi:hypothetical protein